MPNQPTNRPAGRQRTGGGQGQSVSTHGPGLGTGPVGKTDAYGARREQRQGGQGGAGGSQGGGQRAIGGGKGKLILIVAIIAVLLLGGGKGLSGLLGGGNGGNDTPSTTKPSGNSSSLVGSLLGGLSGGFSGNGSYSQGWDGSDNTGKLNTNVSSEARAKRTAILGNNRDEVTIMVYLCGTDLESKSGMASNDLKEMASADLGSNINLLVYTGGCRQWKTSGISNSVNQIYKVENGKLRLLVKDDGSAPMTSAGTLTRFINYCRQNYPANRNELILWDHGGGTVSGFGYDEKNASSGSMRIPEVAKAIKATGVSFDFIGFDACLMATLETALALDPCADYLIASEETEPGIGWYYTNWLTALGRNTSMATTEIGKMIIDDFVSVCGQRCAGQKATLSLIDLSELSRTVGDDLAAFSAATADMISGSGYSEVSQARANTKEFAASNKIDQIDLVHLAKNLNTKESKALADTLLSAVKYNRTSSNVSNAYGISAYFPYRSTGKVNSAVSQLDALGFDEEYTACVKKFASLEVTGQVAGGGTDSPFGSLFGSLLGGGSGSSGAGSLVGSMLGGSGGQGALGSIVGSLLGGETGSSGSSGGVTDIVGALLGGGSGGQSTANSALSALLGGAGIFDRSLTEEELVSMVEENAIDNDLLVWTDDGEYKVLRLTEKQWALVSDLLLNVFLDDGNGYIDLGLDNIFSWTENGDLVGAYDDMWVSLNGQPVAYYYVDEYDTDTGAVVTGRVPVLLNDSRAELLITFENGDGYVSGARFVYADGETDTVAKADVELTETDVIQPICDRYTYEGEYEDTYRLGAEITYGSGITVSDVTLNPNDGKAMASYVLIDRFNTEHWTPVIE